MRNSVLAGEPPRGGLLVAIEVKTAKSGGTTVGTDHFVAKFKGHAQGCGGTGQSRTCRVSFDAGCALA